MPKLVGGEEVIHTSEDRVTEVAVELTSRIVVEEVRAILADLPNPPGPEGAGKVTRLIQSAAEAGISEFQRLLPLAKHAIREA